MLTSDIIQLCGDVYFTELCGFSVEYEVFSVEQQTDSWTQTGDTLDSLSQLTVESSEDCI